MDRREVTDGYLRALQLPRSAPALDYLAEIQRRHLVHFPFASVGVWLGDELSLDLDALYRRIVVDRRGGYCFEQNGLFCEVLAELGFATTLCLARVVLNGDEHPGLTHRITLVDIDGDRYVVDVGFGAHGPRKPVRLDGQESVEQDRVFRIARPQPPEFRLEVRTGGDFTSLYKFQVARYGRADCEIGHFYSHRHPKAIFVKNFVVARILDDEIRSLRNRDYSVLRAQGAERRMIDDAGSLAAILADAFGLRITRAEARRLESRLPPARA